MTMVITLPAQMLHLLSNISNGDQNSNKYSFGTSTDRRTISNLDAESHRVKSEAITDSKNPDYYKYDNLVKLNDIKVPSYSSLDLASLQRSDVLRLSKERAIQNGAIDSKDGNSYFVFCI